jgi:penicillin-binding protein 1A
LKTLLYFCTELWNEFVERTDNMRRKIIHILWGLLGAAVGFSVLSFIAIWNGWVGYMPDIDDLQNPISRSATQVFSADGKLLGTWSYNKENRVLVNYRDIPPHLVNALIATEDVRFREHSGIDFIALGRAIVKRGLLRQSSAGGGSTITQQLAKQLYSGTASSTFTRLLQKPIEWVIAVKLERNYTKEEIVALYLNYFDFLHNAVGIKTAADTYFNKPLADLDINESALLVGLCKNPSLFNPVRYPDKALQRRNVVLGQMLKADYISQDAYDSLSAQPLKLNFHRIDHKEGLAPYLREHLRQYLMAEKPRRSNYPDWNYRQFVIDSIAWETDPQYGWCNKHTKKDGSNYNVYEDGLKIYTTIDSRMQRYAEESLVAHVGKYLQPAFDKENSRKANAPFSSALTRKQADAIMERSIQQSERYVLMRSAGYSDEEIRASFRKKIPMTVFSYQGEVDTVMTPLDSIRYYKSFLRAGFMSMDPITGFVKAYVGGPNYTYFMYDMVSTGYRQVGSTIKPFLYSLAMENGMTPCDVAPNVQQTYMVAGKPWTPRNSSRSRYGEMVSLKWGLSRSNNWISAYLMSRLSPEQFVGLLHSFGINNPEIHPSMSLCLGPCEVSVVEMVSAYTTFVNHGIRTSPIFISKIEDNNGNVIEEFHPRMNEVISAEAADKMLTMLRAVIDEGTGGRIRYKYNIDGEIGGKTGTTNRNSDAWFIGFTPQLVSGCWVGGEDRDIHFDSGTYGQGASMALPIWAYYMQKIYKDKTLEYSSSVRFDVPEDFNPCANNAGGGDGSETDDMTEINLDDIFE